MRIKILVVPAAMVMPDFGKGGKRSYLNGVVDFANLPFTNCDGMPDDARVVGIELADGMLEFQIESETFPDVPKGMPYERMEVAMTTHASYKAYQEARCHNTALKPSSAPSATSSGPAS